MIMAAATILATNFLPTDIPEARMATAPSVPAATEKVKKLENDDLITTEKVRSLEVEYTINVDGSIAVRERIDYQTPVAKHGIYRYLPTKYDDGTEHEVQWIRVEDDDGRRIPYETQKTNSQASIKIGDADITFTGRQIYQIFYRVPRAITQYEEWNELYWDVAGEDWTFPIDRTRAVVRSPEAEIRRVACYSGNYGGDDGLCRAEIISPHEAVFTYDQVLRAGQNVSIVVGLEPGVIVVPELSIGEKVVKWLEKNWVIITAVFPIMVLLAALVLCRVLNKKDEVFINDTQAGLDPTGPTKRRPLFYKNPEVMFYDPFIGSDFTPAQAGYLENLGFHYRLIVAEIFWLVERGYLEVEKVEPLKKNWLEKMNSKSYKGKDDFIFRRTKKGLKSENEIKLKSYQEKILDELVPKGEVEARFSERVNSLAGKTQDLSKKILKSLEEEKYMAKGVTWPLVGTMIAGFLGFVSNGGVTWLINMAVLVTAGAMINKYVHQRTALGNYYTSLVKGLKQTIKSGKWYYEVQEKMMWIEAMIPFSMALGVTKELADKMKDLANDPEMRSEMSASWMTHNWLMMEMMRGDFEKSMVKSFEKAFGDQYQALTSSKSSGSGFSSGGGGFSGGGGGGGGGGSW